MTTLNITKNYNTGSLNFGQALLQAALGGGNCYGGYNSGLGSCNSMTSGLYSAGLMPWVSGGELLGSMLGGIATQAVGVGLNMLLASAIQPSPNVPERPNEEAAVTTQALEQKAAEPLAVLNELTGKTMTLKEFDNSITVESIFTDSNEYVKNVNTATANFDASKAKAGKLEGTYNELKSQYEKMPDGEEKTKFKTEKLDPAKKAYDEEVKKTTEPDGELYKLKKDAVDTLGKKKTAARNAINTLKNLKIQYDETKKLEDAQSYNGTLKNSEYRKVFTRDGSSLMPNLSKSDYIAATKQAISYFTNAKDGSAKKHYAKQVVLLCDKIGDDEMEKISSCDDIYEEAQEYLNK